jgi:hypothetical protein
MQTNMSLHIYHMFRDMFRSLPVRAVRHELVIQHSVNKNEREFLYQI